LKSKSLEALGRLAGGVAHDFNNMLTVILTTADLARLNRERTLDPPLHEDLHNISEAASKAAELTAQLLACGRRQVLAPQVLSLNQVIQGITPLLKRSLPENIELDVKCDPTVANVLADGSQLEQVLVNLVVNARDAMPVGGKLSLATCNSDLDDGYAAGHPEVVPGKYVQLSVCDTGVGMTKEVRSQIFEPFYTTKAHGKGTGLGLATVHGIVRQSGGHVNVYSEPGKGSCFRVYLPATDQTPNATESQAPTHQEKLMGHVLLVEDNDLVRKPVGRMLKLMGLHVTEANGGVEALAALQAATSRIDILLTDVVMCDTTGPELAEKVVKMYPHIQVLHLSGYTEDAIIAHGELSQGVHFISKPFTRSRLQEAIGSLLPKGSGGSMPTA
jgi:two-component system cell cycle sensor histidine kinase/response regulator CckA